MYSGCNCSNGRQPHRRPNELTGGTPKIPLATAYVTFQKSGELFPACEGLRKGTIFPRLFRPCKQ